MYLIKYSRTSYTYITLDKHLISNVKTNGDVLFNVIDVGDEVIVTEETEGPVDYSKDDKEARDNLLFCNQYEEMFNLKTENVTHYLNHLDFLLFILIVLLSR